MYQSDRGGESRCALCFESILNGQGLIEVLIRNDCLCLSCRSQLIADKKILWAGDLPIISYYAYQGMLRQLILRYKESYDRYLARVFFRIHQFEIVWKFYRYDIVCIPSAEKDNSRRGFRHCELLAQTIGLPILGDVLEKTHPFKQMHSSRFERMNRAESMVLKNGNLLANKRVLLLDDVVTTKSSMAAAYGLIKDHCLCVKGLSLSYAPFKELK